MIDIILCIALMGAPNSTETCEVVQSTGTVDTFCSVAAVFAATKPRPMWVSYCKAATEKHPEDVLAKL